MDLIGTLLANWPRLLDGTAMTLKLTVTAALISVVITPLLALGRVHAGPVAGGLLRLYVSFVRGTPLLAQLFLVFYGSGQFRPFFQEWGLWGFIREPFNCCVLVLVMYTTAYQAEILRGGIQAVPRGEVEAAQAVGMTYRQILRRVIFPHAVRFAWPGLGNEMIILVKGSALASVVTVFDLMGRSRQIFLHSFDFAIYIWAAAIYLMITACIVLLWRLIELRLARHMHPSSPLPGASP
ncbi:ABC transporter permease [Kaistia adipata]|uniref:ABC transporter permease n=1 Tax=Kaistia adipata TaxID=166954 RepID=UPI0003FDFE46|nr:ABC transporter permease subunit [Kaistia adipata]